MLPNLLARLMLTTGQGMCIQTCWPSCLQPSPGHLRTDLLAPGAALLTIPPPHAHAASCKILHGVELGPAWQLPHATPHHVVVTDGTPTTYLPNMLTSHTHNLVPCTYRTIMVQHPLWMWFRCCPTSSHA